ncbi:hypothetical protein VE02_03857 [Pseudogymnoascus sp. 03VT05]|nr:hypothetical protein VE02_03857 [Pseudogymnoascus sp. 03VT05]
MANVDKADGSAVIRTRKKNKTTTTSQGNARESPGDSQNPKTFIIETSEQRLCGYIGYKETLQLRLLLVSWPVIKAFLSFNLIAERVGRNRVFHLLYDAEHMFTNVDFETKWEIAKDDSPKEKSNKKDCQVASILIQLESDIHTLGTLREKEHILLQQHYADEYELSFPGAELPQIKFVPGEDGDISRCVQLPTLGPLEMEERLEAINRCWLILKYVRYCRQGNYLESRLSESGLEINYAIGTEHIPTWLQPKTIAKQLESLPKSSALAMADALPKLSVQIIWDKNAHFAGKKNLDDAIQRAAERDVRIPDTSQVMTEDPRLQGSIEAFRDSIRRQFNCQNLLINIRSVSMSYDSVKMTPTHQTTDLMRNPWSTSKSMFLDIANSKFVVLVSFMALDDEDDQIFESSDPPPAIQHIFGARSGEPSVESSNAHSQSIPRSTNAGPGSINELLNVLDSLSGDRAYMEIGSCPDPRTMFPKPEDGDALLAYYDGHNVVTEEGRRNWQRETINLLTDNGQVASVKLDKLPETLSEEEKKAIDEGQSRGQMAAMASEAEDKGNNAMDPPHGGDDDDDHYYTLQSAFSGTNLRAGPPVDLCLQLLDCTALLNGRFSSGLLSKMTRSEFYGYQISGAVGCILKMYGTIDAQKLIEKTEHLNNPRVVTIQHAATQLNDLLMHGCILADEVGLGKTKQALLIALLHSLLYVGREKTQSQNKPEDTQDTPQELPHQIYQPILLVVPPTLIYQWIQELRQTWPYFSIALSYSDHDFKGIMSLHTIPHIAMREYPKMDNMPAALKYLFTKSDPQAQSTIILTSYETHKSRTAIKMTRNVPGVPYKKPQFNEHGAQIWKVPPREEQYLTTKHQGVYSLLIADEAQKIKNNATGLWSILYIQSFPKILLATATPIYNSVIDLIALYSMLWPAAKNELAARCLLDHTMLAWQDAAEATGNIPKATTALHTTDPRRLSIINPEILKRLLKSQRSGLHVRVAGTLDTILNIAMIQRSRATVLPMSVGEPLEMRSLFKRMIVKTAVIERDPSEEIEYQSFHREAAREYINEISRSMDITPGKPRQMGTKGSFVNATRSLRKLAIANCSTKLARLDAVMENAFGNTHAKTLNVWRERGLEANFIEEATRGLGEQKSTTARELVSYLCKGSPALRLALQRVLFIKGIEAFDKSRFKRHQKLIISVSIPACAWYLQVALRAVLIDARVMHAALPNKQRSDMADLFNDPQSTFRVLVMLYDVGAVGLNLHMACNEVLILSVARARAQEAQVGGRALRVTSEFPVTLIRRVTPNSHDQFCIVRQTDKATVQLAVNAQDPAIRALIVKLLNEFQPQVNEFHKTKIARELQMKLDEKAKIAGISRAVRKHHYTNSTEVEMKDVGEECLRNNASNLPAASDMPAASDPSRELPGAKRTRRPVDRFLPSNYSGRGGTLLPPDQRSLTISHTGPHDPFGTCQQCFVNAHFSCHGVPATKGTFVCRECTITKEGLPQEGQDGFQVIDQTESSSSDEPDDSLDDDYEELRIYRPIVSSNSIQDARDEITEAEIEAIEVKSSLLKKFSSEDQPDDIMRHYTTLLQFPKDKVWVDADLQDEFAMRAGLNLLYNKIYGREEMHFDKSIHIRYHSFPRDVSRITDINAIITDRQLQVAKSKGS